MSFQVRPARACRRFPATPRPVSPHAAVQLRPPLEGDWRRRQSRAADAAASLKTGAPPRFAEWQPRKEGATKLGDRPLKEVRKAQSLLAAADPALATNDLCEFLKLLDPARLAVASAIKALEEGKRAAIEETMAKQQEVEEELNRAAAGDGPWGKYVTKGAMIGFAVALVPTLFMTIFTGSSPLEGNIGSLFRFLIIALGASGVGALIGALSGPLGDFNATAKRMTLETARTELAGAIDELKAVPLGNSTA